MKYGELKWESLIDEEDDEGNHVAQTLRARVPGGWLYQIRLSDGTGMKWHSVACCFVPEEEE